MHDHAGHTHGADAGRGLLMALGLTVVILVGETVIAVVSNSLALMSDAGHILTDVFALGVAWLALRRSGRPADERYTFGYRRTGILAALANAGALMVIAAVIGFEAYTRLQHPPRVQGLPVILAALGAIAVNAFIAAELRRHSHQNLNLRAALLHVAGDMAASVGVVIAAGIIILTKAYAVDPIVSWLIAALIAVGAWRIVLQTISILMEATPRGLDVADVRVRMLEIPGINDVHDLHVWSLEDGFRLLSAHVTVPDQTLAEASGLMSDLRLLLARRFHISHSTIEIECEDCTLPVTRPVTLHPSTYGDGEVPPRQRGA